MILGKIAPYFLVASVDMVIVTVLGIVLFGVPFNGNPFAFALGAGMFLFVVARPGCVHLDDLADAPARRSRPRSSSFSRRYCCQG